MSDTLIARKQLKVRKIEASRRKAKEAVQRRAVEHNPGPVEEGVRWEPGNTGSSAA